MEQSILKPNSLKGEIIPPGDKSISHRSLILNSIGSGTANVSNFLPSDDCLATIGCLRSLGVQIEHDGTEVTITGVGESGFSRPNNILDAMNSGTTIRLMAGLLAAQPFVSVITGDKSLLTRPMDRVIVPLNSMGCDVQGAERNTRAPLTIKGQKPLGIQYCLPIASAQVKSAMLLAGLFAERETIIGEPTHSRDHTERMLRAMGAHIKQEGTTITLSPMRHPLTCLDIQIPGDISSAAFWLVAGAIHPNALIAVREVGINPSRTGIIEVLHNMGAKLTIENEQAEANEPVADLVMASSSLKGITIEGALIPRVIDEIPVIAVAAAVAEGTTIIRDAKELRVKESDRISTTVAELRRLGANIEEMPDGMVIHGVPELLGGQCDSHGDHRLAMALAIAGTITKNKTVIANPKVVDISYPQFWEDLEKLCG